MEKKRGQPTLADPLAISGSPNGDRTRVSGVRGRYPRPLDDGTVGWGTRIRTSVNGTRTRRIAPIRSPSNLLILLILAEKSRENFETRELPFPHLPASY